MASFIFPLEALETCNYPEQNLRLQKVRQIWEKSKNNSLFCEKPLSKPVKS